MKTLQESLLHIISPTPIVAEGILDASEINTTVDDAVANMQSGIIKYYSDYYTDKTRKVEIKGDRLLINSSSPVKLAGTFHEPEGIDIVKHIVCNNTYEFPTHRVQHLESITAPTIIIRNIGQPTQLPQLNADNFIILYHGGRNTSDVTIANYDLKCKGTICIKADADTGTWGDDVTLKNCTFSCKKLILISHQNFNTSMGPNPWLVDDITEMGLTKSSKIKQIDCIDYPQVAPGTRMLRYSSKVPKNLNDETNKTLKNSFPMKYPSGWYCDRTCKVTKATYKL